MKLHLITCSEQPVDFLPELEEFLLEQVSDIDVEIHYVANALDLPLQAKISLQNADIAFVTYAYEPEDTRIPLIMEKLIQIELDTGKKIIKALHESSFNDILTEEDLENEKQALVKEWSELIINTIVFPEKFKPSFEQPAEDTDEETDTEQDMKD